MSCKKGSCKKEFCGKSAKTEGEGAAPKKCCIPAPKTNTPAKKGCGCGC